MQMEEEINRYIGAKILTFRKDKKITRSALADVIKVTQQQLDKYERGVNRISGAKLAIISKEHNINISYFFDDLLSENEFNKKEISILLACFTSIKRNDIRQLALSVVRDLSKL